MRKDFNGGHSRSGHGNFHHDRIGNLGKFPRFSDHALDIHGNDRQRMAVVLRYYEQLPLREIAATMDATPKAVERLLARARECLAAELGARTAD